ncbi:TPA: UDP-glucose/GDP-mannose dehydrogenase family protein [archaeon]|uniref:UDP-glucose 6-dehydrogenase n=1 Tax=Candidatus Naiadarchaeum limnaeum TaxID=2756139 RepID=A0A832V5N0_9ARCH|nr:UDP-glucose/GDP-mannose dehydrogenase family protein [Candidatus Naiadarchaeales archaeon SRR2090153.bin1042]HIK00705.1 UDP-glucose/GDP-mannose dehydrogenase family protein [Candidatus Naiadarchaeum limnaeum]
MKISIIGTGYVGLVTGVVLAGKGHEVICVDVDKEKIDRINQAVPPIHEDGLPEMLKAVVNNKKLRATTDLKEAIQNSEICFICVGTPSKPDGSIDLTQLENAVKQVGTALKEKKGFLSIVVKSTVVPGTTENVVLPAIIHASGKKAPEHFSLCYNPEFLREGKAMQDTLKPDKLVIGHTDTICSNNLKQVVTPICPVIETNYKTAELIKYANNAFLATKISFANEIGNLCKQLGIDAYTVSRAIGFDPRIGNQFLGAGLGFGGSCLPKDTAALTSAYKKHGLEPKLLKAVTEINDNQTERFVHLAEKKVGHLSGKQIAVLGTAFKAGTDDTRESPSIKVIGLLLTKGAKVRVFDPKALENTKRELGNKVEYVNSIADCLKDADLCLICTDWPEFKFIDFAGMKNKVVIDGRHIVEKKDGITYEGLSW